MNAAPRAPDLCVATLSPLQKPLSDLCDILHTPSSSLNQKSLLSSLNALNFQEAHLIDELKTITQESRPNSITTFTRKELCIIRDARAGLYRKSDIEGVFYTYGRDEGILALLIIFKKSSRFSRLWGSIHEGFRPWLRRVIELFNRDLITTSARVLLKQKKIKDIYSNAPASDIWKIPEPYRAATQNSRLWKWERSQGLETTGCWPILFPNDNDQDVSVTIWVGYEDGERLANFFGGRDVSF